MSEQIENALRTELHRGADTVAADTAFQDRAIAHSVATRQHHRRNLWVSSAVGAAAVIVCSVGISAALSNDPNASKTVQPIAPNVSDSPSPLEWARGLPEGASPTLAYVLDGALHQGDTTVPLPGERAEIIGDTEDGWLIFTENNDDQGLPAQTGYGILNRSGEFRELPADPNQGSVEVQALSPDGNTFASGGSLIDLRTMQVVGRTPTDAQFASNWTPAGLLYFDKDGNTWLWKEGSASVPVDASSFTSIARDAAIAVTDKRGGCGRVVRVHDDGTLQNLYSGCDNDAPSAVSQDGQLALTWGLRVVDVTSGNSLGTLDIPVEAVAGQHGSMWWESDHAVLLSFEGHPDSRNELGDATGPRPAVIVRCVVPDMTCERAGPELSIKPSEDLSLY